MKVKIKSLKFLILIKRSIYYDIEKSQYGLPTNLTFYQTLIRWSQFLVAAPISLILWVVFRAISRQYKISIYVLSTFRPGIASMYLSLIEPVCRQLQYDKTPKRYTILVNPGENISDVLRDSYAPHFSLYLDDRHKFGRLIAYLVPQKGIKKYYLTGKREFDSGWNHPPSKNYFSMGLQVPNDLKIFDIEAQNYALFVHGSNNYYQKRFPKSYVDSLIQANIDLANYEQPLSTLVNRGLRIVRVGTHVDELPVSIKNLPIIDYTGEKRDAASELWLYENCKLLISVSNGAFWFARRFNRPTIITDCSSFVSRYFSTFYTPSLMKDTKTNKLLSFRQMQRFRIDHKVDGVDVIHTSGLQIVQNSPSTLTAAINETLDYSNGITLNNSLDNELLSSYQIFCQEFNYVFNENTTRPTISFLREYSHLLD
jgi:putative glycosyltransferase (TIGR04372 family)